MITAAEIQMIRNFDPGVVLPGIDTTTGNPYATSTLLDVTKISQSSSAPYFYTPSRNTVTVTQNNAVLSGINFGTATVLVGANNVTINDCTSPERPAITLWSRPAVPAASRWKTAPSPAPNRRPSPMSGSVPTSGHNHQRQ